MSETKIIPISYFKPQFSKKKGKYVPGSKPFETDFYTEMLNIKNGKYYEQVKQIREEQDHDKRQDIKGKTLNALTISAVVDKYRKAENSKHTGLLNIDIDPKDNPEITDWKYTRDLIFELPGVVASFLSVSGQGVTFIVKVDPNKHKDTFYSIKDELYDNFFIKIDKGTHDVCRLRYVSFDPELKLRMDYDKVPITVPSEAYLFNKAQQRQAVTNFEPVTQKDSNECFELGIRKAEQKYGVFSDGCKHYFLTIVAGSCNVRGMSQEYCENKVVEYFSHLTSIPINDLLIPVKNVYQTYRSQFDTAGQKNDSARLNDYITSAIVKNYVHKGVTPKPSDLSHIAEEYQANIERVNDVANRVLDEYSSETNKDFGGLEAKNDVVFWIVDDEDRITLDKRKFRDFLIGKGIYRYRLSVEKWILIRINQNVVSEVNKSDVKKIVMDYLENIKRFDIFQYVAQNITKTFADDFLEILPENNVSFKRDTKDGINVFYTNGFLSISKGEITFHDYDKLDGLIWDTQILTRAYRRGVGTNSDFAKFIYNVSGAARIENEETKDIVNKRYASISSAIGYLMHDYKNMAFCPAVILNDEVMGDNPEGGTGKGILIKAIKAFKSTVSFDGKTFNFDKSFVYQKVELDTKVMAFEDVNKNFDFERLFSVITDGIDVEKKNKGTFHIPFQDSPKIIITTNYAIRGEGNSHDRRRFEIELANHYSKDFTPLDDFGHLLFADWDHNEWADFDTFMAECAKFYLENGLIKQNAVHLDEKRLIANTSQEFYDFIDYWYNTQEPGFLTHAYKADLFDKFISQNKGFHWLKNRTFYKWCENYFNFKGIKFHDGRDMIGRKFEFEP